DYLVNGIIGGQYFSFLVDTGSSDTWVVQKGFNCTGGKGNPVPQLSCGFGTSGFDTDESQTFLPFPDVTYVNMFGNGDSVHGPVGFYTFKVGGLSVYQEIGVPNVATYKGDNISSGILGLAFPNLTNGIILFRNPAKFLQTTGLSMIRFFFIAVKENKVKSPVFSVAVDRSPFSPVEQANNTLVRNLGFLSFGGIAPVPVVNTSVTVPIQGYSADGTPSNAPGAKFLFHTIDIDSCPFPGSTGLVTASNNTIFDTGTSLNIVPTDVAAAYAAAFNSPAVLTSIPGTDLEGFAVDCNAEAPEFLVPIGGKTFSIDPRDQIVSLGEDDSRKIICASGTQPSSLLAKNSGSVFLLGDVFLHNVVATFNPIAREVTLTQRVGTGGMYLFAVQAPYGRTPVSILYILSSSIWVGMILLQLRDGQFTISVDIQNVQTCRV
ncbi:aspartic peptidase domain-containing protein, partial [Mycena rosella]